MNQKIINRAFLFLLLACVAIPSQGRFISEDKWEGQQDTAPSLHKYLYAYQNPTVYVDPDGNAPVLAEMTSGLMSQVDYINSRAPEYRKQGGLSGHFAATMMNVGAGVHAVLGGATGLVNTVADVGISGTAGHLESAGVQFNEYGVVADSRAHLSDVGTSLKKAGSTVVNFHDRDVRSELGRGLVETGVGVANGDADALNRFATSSTALGFGGSLSKLNLNRFGNNPSSKTKLVTENDSGVSGKLASDNKYFTARTNYQAPNKGTGYNYKVHQQNIDPNFVAEIKTRKGTTTITNRELMQRGDAPFVMKNGQQSRIELHHSRQNAQGTLYELSNNAHQALTTKGREALHPYTTKLGRSNNGDGSGKAKSAHPTNPVDRNAFRVDKKQYYKDRIAEIDKDREE